MATVTVSASTTLALLSYAADDDIVGSGAATLTCDSNPNALPAIRSIRSSSPRFTFKVRNANTAFSAGNLWKLSFTNPGSAIGSGQATLGFTSGATMDFEGEWLTCYTATGVASETVLDASNVLGVDIDFPYFIEAETAVGSGVYKAVPVAVIGGSGDGFLTTVDQTAFGTGDVGRVLFYNRSTRLLKTGDGTNGSLFASGIKFRIPNIYIHMPAFTLAVAAGGWTTGTGAQNVAASANAPTLAAGNVNYTAGVECFNISALPSGTSVTVNNRASDGTTATAFTAGTLIYALSNSSAQMAGRVSINTNGIFRSRCCVFSRWMFPVTANGALWSQIDTGITTESNYNTSIVNGVLGETTITRGVIYANHGRGLQACLRASSQVGVISVDGVLCVSSCSAVSTTSHANGGNAISTMTGVIGVSKFDNVRLWKIGYATGMTGYPSILTYQGSTPTNGKISNLETVGGATTIAAGDLQFNGWRLSYTTGFATTQVPNTMLALGALSGAKTANIKVYDYDLMSGGVAPYCPWFDANALTGQCIIHNKVSGAVRSIDCQARTTNVINSIQGSGTIFASSYFTNMRGTGSTQFQGSTGLSNIVRNVRISQSGGVILNQPGTIYDFPPCPWNGNSIGSYSDGGTFYAAPNTYPSLVGGIYLGPVSRKQNLDQYDLTAGAYTDNLGAFFLETTGDVVLFKSPRAVTGVSSITGGAVVYTSHSSITTGVTAEFRLCKWGDDISLVSWGSFTGGNVQTAFAALSGYSSSVGLNFQLRFTATTTVAGRFIRQCYVPCQMDTAYNPPVGTVNVTVVGAAASATAVLYNGSGTVVDTETTSGSGGAVMLAPYDFDDVPVTGTLKIRALQNESIDTAITWSGAATVPAAMAALTGYTAGPDTGVTWNKGTKTVTVTASMTTQDLWSRWRRFIIQLANFDVADPWTYPALNLGDWNIVVSGADLTGNLTTTGTATQSSGGRFLGTVQASNGSSGVLTVTGLSAAQVYVEDAAGVQQDFNASVTGTYTFPTPFGSSGTWTLVVNKPGWYPQAFGFNPQISNSYAITLLQILNPDGTPLYSGGAWPITVTFSTPANCVASFGTQVSVQALFDALQDAYSTAPGMAWLANDNAEATAAITATGHTLNMPLRTRLSGSAGPAAVAGYVTSQDDTVLDPSSAFPIRYAQSPNAAPTTTQIVTALQATTIPVDVKYVNAVQIKGVGTEADPWNPV